MPDAAQLRELAARMLALALDAKDQQLLERLCVRASDYLEQARMLEATQPPATDADFDAFIKRFAVITAIAGSVVALFKPST
jgi:hypothetical protein